MALLENAGMPEKPPKSALPIDDIPEALRDTPHLSRRHRKWQPILLLAGSLGLGAIALIIGILLPRPVSESDASTPVQNQIPGIQTPSATPAVNTLFGHFPYQEAPQSELEAITADGRLKMRKTAARQYIAMVAAARASGVIIVPISGFRSISEQQHLYFDTKAQRGQSAAERAKVSAPPGHSEHHTGYAIDLGDGRVPATNLSPNFERTAAFKWLQKNAPYYSFEISFPRNNPQGVSYEPWHWRYVGDRDSLETFYKAKQFGGGAQPSGDRSVVSPTNPNPNTSP